MKMKKIVAIKLVRGLGKNSCNNKNNKVSKKSK